ncbi:hypothetical protein Ccrd_005569 [Cynara cardunculus var. scolymus]|uniref:Uncharacterized protein n=1 Tax=Cynara cardunculus var. scolymus TaxID=59895 RepID=A0A118JV80_CYNCS|nr:hypothetical protein Ccrd_005569 [Cynara cardunculus var. scolymus]
MAIATYFNSITTIERRLSTSSECSSTSSGSDGEQYVKVDSNVRRSRKWRKMMKKLVEESKKSIYGTSKSLTFGYDAVSYSLNFDEGNHSDEYYL